MNVAERVIDIIEEQFGYHREITPAHTFDDLGADSLDAVEMAMEVEEEFEISIPDWEIEKVKTVAEAIALVERLVAA